MDFLNYNSVETLPGFEARAAFSGFREDGDIVPSIVDDTLSYVPWGGDNQMPFDLLSLSSKDETLATCQCFNAEVCMRHHPPTHKRTDEHTEISPWHSLHFSPCRAV